MEVPLCLCGLAMAVLVHACVPLWLCGGCVVAVVASALALALPPHGPATRYVGRSISRIYGSGQLAIGTAVICEIGPIWMRLPLLWCWQTYAETFVEKISA